MRLIRCAETTSRGPGERCEPRGKELRELQPVSKVPVVDLRNRYGIICSRLSEEKVSKEEC